MFHDPKIDITFTLRPREVHKVDIDHRLRMEGTHRHGNGKAILVQASDEILVYGVNKEEYSNDAFLVYPTDTVGREYYTVSYWPPHIKTQFAIVGVYDDTFVSILLPSSKNGTQYPLFQYDGKTWHTGDTLNLTMDRYDTVQFQSKEELTGTHIVSNRRVSVFSGNVRTNVITGKSRDHLAVQLPPVVSWGRKYITVPIPGRSAYDLFRFVASEDNTEVLVDGKRIFLAKAGDFKQERINSDTYAYVEANKPILTVQIALSQMNESDRADPTMIVYPSIEQYGSNYSFATTKYSLGSYDNYFTIIIENQRKDGLYFNSKKLDVAAQNASWMPIPNTNHVATQFLIPEGAHNIYHEDPEMTFAGFLYGSQDRESYGFAIGMRLSKINTVNRYI